MVYPFTDEDQDREDYTLTGNIPSAPRAPAMPTMPAMPPPAQKSTFNKSIGLPIPEPPPQVPLPAPPPQDLSALLAQRKAATDPYGPEQQMAVAQDIEKRRGSLGRVIPQAMGGLADALMQGVARAGPSNFQSNIVNQQNLRDKAVQDALEKAYGQKKEQNAIDLKMSGYSPSSAISKSGQDTNRFILKQAGMPEEEILKLSDDGLQEMVKQLVTLKGDQLKAGSAKAALDAKPVKSTLLPGEIARDRKFGQDYESYVAQGGAQGAAANFAKLDESLKHLKERGAGVATRTSSMLPDVVRGLVTPEYKAIEQDMRSNVVSLLRATLGPQFTEKEGERIFAQTFDPSLPAAQNINRLNKLKDALQNAAKTKEDAGNYFEEHGTLTGWKGSLPSFGDVENAVGGGGVMAPDKAARLAELRAKKAKGTLGAP